MEYVWFMYLFARYVGLNINFILLTKQAEGCAYFLHEKWTCDINRETNHNNFLSCLGILDSVSYDNEFQSIYKNTCNF